jgi:hypothetical protein
MSRIFYVNNLRQASDLSELESMFSLVGDVESQRMESHLHSSRGVGFGVFEMATEQQAADCIERFHGVTLLGYPLSVTAKMPVVMPMAPPEPPKGKKRAHGQR